MSKTPIIPSPPHMAVQDWGRSYAFVNEDVKLNIEILYPTEEKLDGHISLMQTSCTGGAQENGLGLSLMVCGNIAHAELDTLTRTT